NTTINKQSAGDTGHDPIVSQAPEETFSEIESKLKGRTGESEAEDDLLSHIRTRVTDEGLIIEVFAKEGRPLFDGATDQMTPKMVALLDMIGGVISLVANRVAVTGHTDATPFEYEGSDNWRLSAAQADRARRHLSRTGVTDDRFVRVTGKADRQLALPDLPNDPRNRRITLTLLRSSRAE
ncbi:MAG: OmpA family protein, partial [Pseudomonadota bacterium]